MLKIYRLEQNSIKLIESEIAKDFVSKLVWIDLFSPTKEEENFVEELLKTNIPTRDEMHEIEISNRLYQENGIIYTTATIVTKADTVEPESHAISFILSNNCLITIRYSDPAPFKVFSHKIISSNCDNFYGIKLFSGLMEAIVNRIADILENAGHEIDNTTKEIFRPNIKDKNIRTKNKPDLEDILRQVGIRGDLISKARESMLSISRLLVFALQTSQFKSDEQENEKLQILLKDIHALNDHASFLSGKVNFLLDATLGMISIEQNSIIKIFSVAAVVFLPPTLVASIYGMNFNFIPELKFYFGYPMALIIMVLSAYLPYKFFKHKGWL